MEGQDSKTKIRTIIQDARELEENMNATQLRIVTRWDSTYSYDVRISNGTNGLELQDGYAVDILNELAWMLNFSYLLVPEVDTFGFENSTQYGIDLFAASYSLFKSRAVIIDPSFVIGTSQAVALINYDFDDGLSSFNFLQPMKSTAWAGTFGLIFIILLSHCFCTLSENNEIQVFHAVALLLQKSTNETYNRWQTKLTIWITLISSLMFWSCYTGSLTSFLTVQSHRINTLEELLKSKYEIMLERGYNNGSPIQYIAESLKDYPTMVTLLDRAKKSGFVYESFEKSINRVEKSASAYIIDYETAIASIGHFPCGWGSIPLSGIRYQWSMFLPKNSKHKKLINQGLLAMVERGVLRRMRDHYIPQSNNPKCSSGIEGTNQGIGLQFVSGAFFLLVVGTLVPFVTILVQRNFNLGYYRTIKKNFT